MFDTVKKSIIQKKRISNTKKIDKRNYNHRIFVKEKRKRKWIYDWLKRVDRKSRYEIIKKVDDLKGITVGRAMIEALKGKKVKSLTIDNGGEFSKIRSFKKKGIAINRCHAYSSWEKGTNERHNGMIRWRIPKGYDISLIDEESIKKIEMTLNHKPRKILGYRTLYEIYHSINLNILTNGTFYLKFNKNNFY